MNIGALQNLNYFYEQTKDVDKAIQAFTDYRMPQFAGAGNPQLSFNVAYGRAIYEWKTSKNRQLEAERKAKEQLAAAEAGFAAAQKQRDDLAAQQKAEAERAAEAHRQAEAAAEAARARQVFNSNNQQLDMTNLRSNDPEVNPAITTSTGEGSGTGLADRVLGGEASVQAQNTAAQPVTYSKRRRRGLSAQVGINL